MPHEDDLIRPAAAADLAGVSVPTVRRWLREGRLSKYTDERRRVWVDRNQVLALNKISPAPAVTGVGA